MSTNQDRLIYATAADNQIRCMAAVTTSLVSEACRRHHTLPTASVALGRTLTGGLLLGSTFKDLEKLTVQFDCEGPIGSIIAQADAHGCVRGYVSNPEAHLPAGNAQGKFDVRGIVGGGMMYVTRDAGFEIGLLKKPYRGSVPIVSGEIGEDFAYYLGKSEQINSAVSLGVLMNLDHAEDDHLQMEHTMAEFDYDRIRISAAGGYMIQMMPAADESLLAEVEQSISHAPSSTDMIRDGMTPAEMLKRALGDLDVEVLDEMEPRFYCHCSRERVLRILSSISRSEIEDMLEKDNGAELVCHFCNEKYQVSADELRQILEEED